MVGRTWSGLMLCVALLCLMGTACTDAGAIELVCNKFCRCENPSPAAQNACNDECVTGLAGAMIPDECVDCIALNECSDIEDTCQAACQVAVPRMSLVEEETVDEEID